MIVLLIYLITLTMVVKVICKSHEVPQYMTTGSAGVDLKAYFGERMPDTRGGTVIYKGKEVTLNPGVRALIPTGLYIQLPEGYEAQIRPRSGLAWKHGVTVLNTPRTIDADYTGEIGVILINQSNTPFVINDGDRIAQMVIAKVEHPTFCEVDKLEETERGDGGFGHTGVK